MLGLYRNTTSLVDHAHQTLDEAERTMLNAQRELKKVREQVAVATLFAYVAALAAVCTLIVLDGHVRRTKAAGFTGARASGGYVGRD
jgi:hypothetical protein